MSKALHLTDEDFSTLANALESAANRYEECCKDLADVPGHQRLVEQFERQAAVARMWAARFMAADECLLTYDDNGIDRGGFARPKSDAEREAEFFGGPAS